MRASGKPASTAAPGDHSFFHLPNSGLLVSASPTWWQPGGPYDDRPFLAPDVAAEPSFADCVANRDPAMNAIVAWETRITLADRVLEALGGIDQDAPGRPAPAAAADPAGAMEAAAGAVHAWSSEPANRYRSATAALNALAYRLLRAGRIDPALTVFRLNVYIHPEYANGWESLGEGLLEAGLREEALRAYRRALELDPHVGNAAEMVRRLEGGPDAHSR